MTVKSMQKHLEIFEHHYHGVGGLGTKKSFAEYCDDMLIGTRWGGELEVFALAGAFNVSVILALTDITKDILRYNAGKETIMLLWYTKDGDSAHYEPLVSIDETDCKVHPHFQEAKHRDATGSDAQNV